MTAGFGSFGMRGTLLSSAAPPAPEEPAEVYLSELAVEVGATSVWFAPGEDPFVDVVGVLDLAGSFPGIRVRRFIPAGVGGFYTLPQDGGPPMGGPHTGANAALSRTTDRGFELLFRGTDYGFPSGGVLQLGEFSDADAWGVLKYDAGYLSWFAPDDLTLLIQGPVLADTQGKWVLIILSYDHTAEETTMRWSIEGSVEGSGSAAQAASGTPVPKTLMLGAMSIPTAGLVYAHAALYAHTLDATHMDALQGALGWS